MGMLQNGRTLMAIATLVYAPVPLQEVSITQSIVTLHACHVPQLASVRSRLLRPCIWPLQEVSIKQSIETLHATASLI